MIPPDRIYAIADACLDAVVAHYATLGTELPARQYVANGTPAYDCEQLTVNVESTAPITGSPLNEIASDLIRDAGHAMRSGLYAVTILRCIPTLDDEGDPPPVTDEAASSALIYADAVNVLNALIAAEIAGEIPGHGSVVFRGWQSVEPQGGLGGGILRVSISLAGL